MSANLAPDLDAELHKVATTPSSVVARQMNRMFQSSPMQGKASVPAFPGVRDFMELGERAFAQKAADELASCWRQTIAPLWPSIAAGAEADADHRAHHRPQRSAHRTELPAPADHLSLRRSAPGERTADRGGGNRRHHPLSFGAGAQLARQLGSLAGTRHLPHLSDLLPSGPDRSARGTDPLRGSVIGHSRFALLADLDVRRTTPQFADRREAFPTLGCAPIC
ncbi:hypothetical protein ACFW1M_26630 [Streptomyces inhibens]|uniref:hypothetical protein n=1 Tax=Streptomyces inhibens TaxID=2293571 RepID=UPI003673911B